MTIAYLSEVQVVVVTIIPKKKEMRLWFFFYNIQQSGTWPMLHY